ncbi:MAG TPA: c-type cytochrome [Aliidongia sp.]|uniref:c-type cytochrome n=1 Tax=Aliidongia sp. TaxID=1914230 RepID=UPI002DDD9EB9|nr:c-type cytochrome [Aliidongia sp.]HEV2673259.1 c-type cytochrome [Aliidongia sp.]
MRSPTALRLVLAVLALAGCRATEAAEGPQDFGRTDRGRYLTIVGDCAACHTQQGSSQQFAGGRPIETPFGTLLAPNITPDRETGIGAWTDDEFVGALTRGTGRGGAHLYPAMPYPSMTKLSRDDALTIRAYLNSVPPAHHPVVANQLPFPFSIRLGMAAWDALYFTPGAFQPVAGKSEEWNRGAYLVEGPMHCGACHTPKNFLGGDKSASHLQGYALQGWFAPNITNDARSGLGHWTTGEIVAYLKSGHTAGAAASGPMAEEVALSSSKMADADLQAVAVYLKDQPGQDQPAPAAPSDTVMTAGAAIYADECSACHASTGTGVPGLFPALAGASGVQSSDPASLLHVVLRGTRSVATETAPTAPAMPSFAWLLSDDQVAAVATYVRNAWGNAAPAVTGSDVGHARRDLAERTD